MLRSILKRLLTVIPTLILASMLTFGLLKLIPGDPATVIAGDNATPERLAEIRGQLHLDDSLPEQYGRWASGAIHGDLGTSLFTPTTVSSMIKARLPATVQIVLAALLLSIFVGIPLGFIAGWRADTGVDKVARTASTIGIGIPNFWLGMLLVTAFALNLKWFPAVGFRGITSGLGTTWKYLLLPAIALGAASIAETTRQMRSAVLEVRNRDFVRTLRSIGLPNRTLFKHVAKNVAVPVLTVIGLQASRLLGATVIVEAVFGINGVGSLVVDSVGHRDYPMVQGVVIVMALLIVGGQPAGRHRLPSVRPEVALMAEGAPARRDRRPGAWHGVRRWLGTDRRAQFGVGFIVLILIAAVLAILFGQDPLKQDLDNILAGPSLHHWLGTDDLGRDVFSRLLAGSLVSLRAASIAVGVALVIGVPLGLLAGFMGGVSDEIVMRGADTVLAFPGLVLAVGVVAMLGPGLTNAMIAVGIVFAPSLARLMRAQVMGVRNHLYVEAATTFGGSSWQLIKRHIVPNSIQPVIVQTSLLFAGALLAEAGLSFIGLGVQPPDPSWGSMLGRAYRFMRQAPMQMIAPGLIVMVTALAFNSIGDSLRDELDPTRRRSRRVRQTPRAEVGAPT